MSAIEFVDLSQEKPISTYDLSVAKHFGLAYRAQYECWAIVHPEGWIAVDLDWPEYRSGGANFVL